MLEAVEEDLSGGGLTNQNFTPQKKTGVLSNPNFPSSGRRNKTVDFTNSLKNVIYMYMEILKGGVVCWNGCEAVHFSNLD